MHPDREDRTGKAKGRFRHRVGGQLPQITDSFEVKSESWRHPRSRSEVRQHLSGLPPANKSSSEIRPFIDCEMLHMVSTVSPPLVSMTCVGMSHSIQ